MLRHYRGCANRCAGQISRPGGKGNLTVREAGADRTDTGAPTCVSSAAIVFLSGFRHVPDPAHAVAVHVARLDVTGVAVQGLA